MFKKILTVPLSGLYALGVSIRHFLYDKHLLLSHSVSVPTICVGNLALGGTGKTPMTEYLVRLLLENGYKPAVLSRGYKRTSRGYVFANKFATVETIGDEAMQLHQKFRDVPVAVCENRVKGIRFLQQLKDKIDVVILDDAMQHRALRCGLTILLTPYDQLYIDDHLLPWGNLRDLSSRSLKADAVVVTKCPFDMQPIDMRVVDNRLHLPSYQQLHFAGIEYDPIEQEGTPLVLCGIAQPKYLMNHVRKFYPNAELMAYRDHYLYSPKDVDAIIEKAQNFDFVLTTEKDLPRLGTTDLEKRLADQGKPLIALPIRQYFCSSKANFDRQILTYVRENTKVNSK